MTNQTVLVLCAHNDDQIFGAGATLAKYAKKGINVKSIIFSFGESSHPHLRPEVIIKTRIKESLAADKVIGGAGIAYLGLKEGKFPEEIEKKNIKERIRLLIKSEKPIKVFTHSLNDGHRDHRAVVALVNELLDDIPCEVYSFEIWTPFRIRNRYNPKLIEDVSDTFKTKINAIQIHKSQKVTIVNLILSIYFKAKIHGLFNGFKYAEVFDKIK